MVSHSLFTGKNLKILISTLGNGNVAGRKVAVGSNTQCIGNVQITDSQSGRSLNGNICADAGRRYRPTIFSGIHRFLNSQVILTDTAGNRHRAGGNREIAHKGAHITVDNQVTGTGLGNRGNGIRLGVRSNAVSRCVLTDRERCAVGHIKRSHTGCTRSRLQIEETARLAVVTLTRNRISCSAGLVAGVGNVTLRHIKRDVTGVHTQCTTVFIRFIIREDGIGEGCRLTLNVEGAAVARFIAGKFGRSNVNSACTAHINSTTVTGLAFPNHVVREHTVRDRECGSVINCDRTAGNLRRITVENRLVNGNRGITYTKGTTTLFGAVAGEGAASDGASRLVTDLVDTTVSINLIAGMNGVLNLEICHTGNKTNTTAGGSVVVSKGHAVNKHIKATCGSRVTSRGCDSFENRTAQTGVEIACARRSLQRDIKAGNRSADDTKLVGELLTTLILTLRHIRQRHTVNLGTGAVGEFAVIEGFSDTGADDEGRMIRSRLAGRGCHCLAVSDFHSTCGNRSHRTAGNHRCRNSDHRLCALGLNGRSRFIDDHQRRTRLGEDDFKRLVHLTKLRKFSFFCTALCVLRAPPPIEAVHPQNKNSFACLLGGVFPYIFQQF